MTDVAQQTGVMSVYRGTLEPIYEEICGDRATYFGVEREFTQYLQGVSAVDQQPVEDVGYAFRQFLAYGQNCPENSLAKHMTRNAQGLVTDLTASIESARDGITLYEPFRLFRNAYIETIEHIHSLNNSEFIERTGRAGVTWHVDRASMMRMWRTANLAETLSSNLLYQVAKKLFAIQSNDFEIAVIRAEHAALSRLSEVVLAYNNGITPAQSYELRAVIGQIEAFEKVHAATVNPLGWAAALFPEVIKLTGWMIRKGFRIKIHTAYRDQPLKHATPAILMEFMERTFFMAARAGISLDFSIQRSEDHPPQYHLVINSGHSLDALRKDLAVSYLATRLGARWDTPGFLTRIVTRPFQTLKGFKHRILIPLMKPQSSVQGSNNGGTQITGFSPATETNLGNAPTIFHNPNAGGALFMSYGIQLPVNMNAGLMPTIPVMLNPALPIMR